MKEWGVRFLKWKGCFSKKRGLRVGFRPHSTVFVVTSLKFGSSHFHKFYQSQESYCTVSMGKINCKWFEHRESLLHHCMLSSSTRYIHFVPKTPTSYRLKRWPLPLTCYRKDTQITDLMAKSDTFLPCLFGQLWFRKGFKWNFAPKQVQILKFDTFLKKENKKPKLSPFHS